MYRLPFSKTANKQRLKYQIIQSASSSSAFPSQSRVVIAGAGVVANSVAYHLTQAGWRDVTVIEQRRIGSGTSHFGSGILGLFKPISHRNVIWYSINLYKKLQNMGYNVEMKQCGSLNLAQTKDRLIALKRRVAYNLPTGLHCELLSPSEIQKYHPHVKIDDLEGAVWVPDDTVINPKAICDTLALLAQKGGANYIEHTTVQKVLTNNNGVYAVETNKGTVHCEYFINCAGMWARELGLQCTPQVRIPAYPAEHFYACTGNLDSGMPELLPIVRDYDGHTYARQYQNGFLVGWFERQAKPAFENSTVPKNWKKHVKNDVDHFRPLWEHAVSRFPILSTCLEPLLVNSPDNFTPDGRWILGEAPEVKNYFVACGMNGNSLQGAGGIGKAVAEWIVEGEPRQDLLPFILQRFLNVHNSRFYLKQRIKEVVGRHYSILYPFQCEYKYARELRCSPLYSVLETRGAVFGIKMAYERALYFDSTYKKGQQKPKMPEGTFFKPKFFEFIKEEYLACIEGVGIIDMSSFSKIEIKLSTTKRPIRINNMAAISTTRNVCNICLGIPWEEPLHTSFPALYTMNENDHRVLIQSTGNEALDYLQRICSNDVDIPIGSIVHTGMQNVRGGYENDCMLVRQSTNSFFMVSPTSQQTRVYEWMKRNLPDKRTVVLNDVTSMYTVLNVVGPKSSDLLSELSNSDLKIAPFSYMKVNVGYASDVMVMSFTHTGEPGYCLYIPSEYALHVYYKLMTVGRDYGIRDVGVMTQRFMRLERFIPFWAEELNSFTTPFEAGNEWSVKLDKKHSFIGRDALIKQSADGLRKRLVFFHFNDIDPDVDIWPWGGEPLYRNDKFVGTVTSTGYGFAANKLICLGFITKPADDSNKIVTRDYILSKSAKYEIDIAGHRFSATPYLHAPNTSNDNMEKKEYRPTAIKYKSDISA